jgi:hypothetical protein
MKKNISLKDLKQQYEFCCDEYIKKFCKKQDMEFYGWVGDFIGTIAFCNDFYFDFQDIVLDINSKQKKGVIIDWYYDNLESENLHINYNSYIKGLRISDLKKS